MNTQITINNNIYNPPLPDYDPLNPPYTVPGSIGNVIHPDAREIIERLMGATTESDVRRIIWETFRDLFMDCNDGDQDYKEAIYDVWKWYIR